MKAITRFAPSPTGALHLGGARTAIFSYLWAKHTGGKFVLRIEDTDTERSKKEHTHSILQSMQWLGLSWEEPLWYQSQRIDVYKSYVQKLLNTGHAYYCTCTNEEVEQMREKAKAQGEQPKYNEHCREKALPYTQGCVVRLKTPHNEDILIQDIIKGDIVINTRELDDMVLCRADGMPTYNLAVVVDDYEMGITYVIRGDDHISNTPKQILLYKALALPIPHFAHVPMILGEDKQKLSKRHGATAVIEYQNQGFLPEAMVNYLVRLGWSHGDEELFTLENLVQLFTLEHLNASPSALDFDKLRWVNAHYIKTLPIITIVHATIPFIIEELSAHNITPTNTSTRYKNCIEEGEQIEAVYSTLCTHSQTTSPLLELLCNTVEAFRERAQTLIELAKESIYIFMPHTALDYSSPPKNIEKSKEHAIALVALLEQCSVWERNTIENSIQHYMQEHSLQNKDIFPAMRFALTATKGGPDIPVLLHILGKEEVVQRINRCFGA